MYTPRKRLKKYNKHPWPLNKGMNRKKHAGLVKSADYGGLGAIYGVPSK